MDSIRRAVVYACAIFAGAVVGDLLQWLLPTHHLADAKGVIGAVQGLVTALLALVLGLLCSSTGWVGTVRAPARCSFSSCWPCASASGPTTANAGRNCPTLWRAPNSAARMTSTRT